MTANSKLTDLLTQSYEFIPSFTLECGDELLDVPVAYKTWGKLNENKDNVMIICHALTGSADVDDWWGPLMGSGKAFDPTRYFIFCANVLGSPYGTASPITTDPKTSKPYGPEFPPTTIRDDVRLHKLVLDSLGVSSVRVVIGGSMGGMAVLEWPLVSPPGYVKRIIPLATSARHSAWCISWGEAQRQCIYSDPAYDGGYYYEHGEEQARGPRNGLAAARMSALLTYRSRDSFESRFGRRNQPPPVSLPRMGSSSHLETHNEGHRPTSSTSGRSTPTSPGSSTTSAPKKIFTAQGYLRYQGDKFTSRFDANCYIHITRKMDTHDVARGRTAAEDLSQAAQREEAIIPAEDHNTTPEDVERTLATLPPRALVFGIATDGLFTLTEQKELARCIPEAELVVIESPDGHDGFLLEFAQINTNILRFLHREFPDVYSATPSDPDQENSEFDVKKTSIFGEAEADVAHW